MVEGKDFSQKDSSDFEIGDVENFQYNKEEAFSHQSLVMSAMKRCLEFGAHELVEGLMETNVDSKGNIKQVYREDTRKRFVESIKCCKMVMVCDFDNDAKDNIKNLIKKIDDARDKWLKKESDWFKGMPYETRQNAEAQGYFFMGGYFSNKLPFKDLFYEEELNIWREIFEELSLLTKRLSFYKSEELEA